MSKKVRVPRKTKKALKALGQYEFYVQLQLLRTRLNSFSLNYENFAEGLQRATIAMQELKGKNNEVDQK